MSNSKWASTEAIRREASQSHHERMEQFVRAHCTALRPRLAQVVRQGTVRHVIVERVEHLRRDLLIVGTHCRAGIAHGLIGSVAEDLLSHPPCDVLAVRP